MKEPVTIPYEQALLLTPDRIAAMVRLGTPLPWLERYAERAQLDPKVFREALSDLYHGKIPSHDIGAVVHYASNNEGSIQIDIPEPLSITHASEELLGNVIYAIETYFTTLKERLAQQKSITRRPAPAPQISANATQSTPCAPTPKPTPSIETASTLSFQEYLELIESELHALAETLEEHDINTPAITALITSTLPHNGIWDLYHTMPPKIQQALAEHLSPVSQSRVIAPETREEFIALLTTTVTDIIRAHQRDTAKHITSSRVPPEALRDDRALSNYLRTIAQNPAQFTALLIHYRIATSMYGKVPHIATPQTLLKLSGTTRNHVQASRACYYAIIQGKQSTLDQDALILLTSIVRRREKA